jgi:hypothetical protein
MTIRGRVSSMLPYPVDLTSVKCRSADGAVLASDEVDVHSKFRQIRRVWEITLTLIRLILSHSRSAANHSTSILALRVGLLLAFHLGLLSFTISQSSIGIKTWVLAGFDFDENDGFPLLMNCRRRLWEILFHCGYYLTPLHMDFSDVWRSTTRKWWFGTWVESSLS